MSYLLKRKFKGLNSPQGKVFYILRRNKMMQLLNKITPEFSFYYKVRT